MSNSPNDPFQALLNRAGLVARHTATPAISRATRRHPAALSEFELAFLNGAQRSVNRKVQGSNPWSGANCKFETDPAALKPVLTELKFRTGRYRGIGGWSGWQRDAPPFSEFFWIQINHYGFDRHFGGEFVVEFELSDSERHTSIRDRMWRLLGITSRSEVIRMNNQTIKALPGPSGATLQLLPECLKPTYLRMFETMDEDPKRDADVWFRYATRADVEAWGEFLAARLKGVVESGEKRLSDMPEGAAVLLGRLRHAGEEMWTSLDS